MLPCASAVGQSLTLNGPNGGYAQAVGGADLQPNQFTVEAWIKPTANSIGGGAGTIVANALPGGCYGYAGAWFLWRFDDGRIALLVGHGVNLGVTATSAAVVPIGSTAHVAGTFDGQTARVYVNGQLSGQAAWTAGWTIAYNNYPVRVGATDHCGQFLYRFVGSIADVRLWNRSLQPTELASVDCASPATDDALLASWRLNGSFADSSGRNRSLSPVAGTTFGSSIASIAYQARVASNPIPMATCPSSTTGFSVTASGTGPFTYQWRKAGNLIGTIGNPSAATNVLTLSNVGPADVASYDCIVTNACGSVTSNPATLTLATKCSLADIVGTSSTSPGGPIVCGDSTVDGSDFVAFINSFAIGDVSIDPLADVAGAGPDGLSPDGIIDGSDFVAFINAFALGC